MYIYEKIDITNYELTEHLPETILSNLAIFLLIKNMLETVNPFNHQIIQSEFLPT